MHFQRALRNATPRGSQRPKLPLLRSRCLKQISPPQPCQGRCILHQHSCCCSFLEYHLFPTSPLNGQRETRSHPLLHSQNHFDRFQSQSSVTFLHRRRGPARARFLLPTALCFEKHAQFCKRTVCRKVQATCKPRNSAWSALCSLATEKQQLQPLLRAAAWEGLRTSPKSAGTPGHRRW